MPEEPMTQGWKSGLMPVLERISKVASGPGKLRVLTAGERLALAIPTDRRAAAMVIDLYRPQRWKGRMFRRMAAWQACLGLAESRPTFHGAPSQFPEVEWLRPAAERGMIGFLGCNPNHGLRCVLAGIDPESGENFVAKLGFDHSASAVQREHETLERLHSRNPGVLPSMGCEQGQDWALLRLPHLGSISPSSMADPRISALLESWMQSDTVELGTDPWTCDLLDRVPQSAAPAGWHTRMRNRRVRRALLHGDFAVWNLREVDGNLCALDWEWAQENGIAGVDLAHGLRQEAYMVRKLSPGKAIAWMLDQANSPTWQPYLKATGWADAPEDWLRLGLLHSHYNALNPSAELLEVLGIR